MRIRVRGTDTAIRLPVPCVARLQRQPGVRCVRQRLVIFGLWMHQNEGQLCHEVPADSKTVGYSPLSPAQSYMQYLPAKDGAADAELHFNLILYNYAQVLPLGRVGDSAPENTVAQLVRGPAQKGGVGRTQNEKHNDRQIIGDCVLRARQATE